MSIGPGPLDIQQYWDYDDPAGSETRLRAALAGNDAGDDAARAELLTQVARARGLQRDFDGAHAMLDEAEALITPSMSSRPRVRLRLERGRALNSSGERATARPMFVEAWELARSDQHDGLAVDAAHMLGIVDPPEEALRWNERALALAQSSDDPDARRWLGSLHNNMGWTWHGAGDFATALEHFEAALRHRRDSGTASERRVARWAVARCLRSLGRLTDAMEIQRALESEMVAAEAPDGFVYEEIAECLHAQDHADDARPYFVLAWSLLSKDAWLVDAEPQRLDRLKNLGQT